MLSHSFGSIAIQFFQSYETFEFYQKKMFEPRLRVDALHMNKQKNDSQLRRLQLNHDGLPRQSWQLRCREHFNQYLLNTTLHGLKYVGDRKCTRPERWAILNFWSEYKSTNCPIHFRVFFAIMFVMVMSFSVYFITNVWNRWNESPLVVTLSAISTSVKDLPFPGSVDLVFHVFHYRYWIVRRSLWFWTAVTICNVNQAQRTAVSRIPRESEEYSVLQSICRNTIDENVTNSVAGTWNIFRKVLLDVSSLVEIKWKGKVNQFHLFISNRIAGGSAVWPDAHRMSIWWIQYELLDYFQ